jgi:phosphoglucomutase
MTVKISPLAGKPATPEMLVDVPKLITAYYTDAPDPVAPAQRVAFGASGHRGSAFDRSFNEDHILAITQAICLYRKGQATDGPLFLGIDTHALSIPATPAQKELLAKLSPQQVRVTELAGEKIQTILTHAPGNGAPIGGVIEP